MNQCEQCRFFCPGDTGNREQPPEPPACLCPRVEDGDYEVHTQAVWQGWKACQYKESWLELDEKEEKR